VPSARTSVDDVNDMIEQQCKDNPDDLLAAAVQNVLDDLYKTRTKVGPDK